jgi:hypothetical protein
MVPFSDTTFVVEVLDCSGWFWCLFDLLRLHLRRKSQTANISKARPATAPIAIPAIAPAETRDGLSGFDVDAGFDPLVDVDLVWENSQSSTT